MIFQLITQYFIVCQILIFKSRKNDKWKVQFFFFFLYVYVREGIRMEGPINLESN
jgi:hypothetical protein